MNLIGSVYKIFEEVKSLTGKEVQLLEKKDLDTPASVKVARKNMSAHLMYYKPEHTEIINHLIAHECGHIMRIYSAAESDRIMPYTDDQIKLRALKDIEPEVQILSKTLPFENLVKIVNIWYSGMIKQLTNFPSDIMIEKWIYDKYAELRSYQAQSIQRQYNEAALTLSFDVEKMTPKKILIASSGMNCAFFRILGMYFNSNYQANRFDRSPYSKIGEKLITLQRSQQDNYKGDIATITKWGEALNLSHWFAWKDFEDIPTSYLNTF